MLDGASLVDGIAVEAVASRDAERADTYARKRGIPRAYATYEALLGDDEIDAVYVPLPNGMHHEWTMRALQSGKHVLCEKPYSRRPAEVEEAFDLAGRSDLVLMEAFMYRHHPQTVTVAELVAGGAIGRLRTIRVTSGFQLDRPEDVRLAADLDGGALMDVGCYCISGSRLLAGEPERVYGEQVTGETGVDLAFHGVLRFADDVVAQFDCSFVQAHGQRLEAVGDEGTVVVASPFRPDLGRGVTLRRGDESRGIEIPEARMFALELENFASAIAGEAPPLLDRADALGQARTIDALYRSAAERRAIDLP